MKMDRRFGDISKLAELEPLFILLLDYYKDKWTILTEQLEEHPSESIILVNKWQNPNNLEQAIFLLMKISHLTAIQNKIKADCTPLSPFSTLQVN